ncbi:MAG: carboxypeptidase regulatory-like domain-containing protein, partial [Candidatus Syntrophosphaera sp.]
PSDNDLAAISITGNTTPTEGEEYDYTISVKNRGLNPQTTYSVKLYVDDVEAGTVAGVAIQPNETLTFDIPWTPASEGPAVLYGKVVLAGDENPDNDQTPDLDVTVQPTGVQAVTIGDGSENARMPMDFYWKNSLYECLFYPDELGFVSGTITSLQFYNNFSTNLPNGATKIWLGTTNLQDLSGGYIPSTQLTLVFDGNVQYPAGQNTITIPLQTPYMHTPGNLVMMVNRPMDAVYYSSSDYFQCQTGTQQRARNTYSDSTTFDPANPPDGTLTAQFPKTTIFYSGQAIVNDMGALSITGNTTPSVGAATDYTVTVKNNGTATQDTYTVKLMKEGDIEIASVPGVTIESMETLQFSIPWTPTEIGPTYIWGEVELAGDEIATNNETPPLNVVVQQQGIVAVTVGQGGSTGRMPVDMYYRNSLFETIYLASELNIGGLLTAIQFYNSFNTNLPAMPTNIWVGETTQGDLSADWIPSTELTQVFSGNVDYPSGQNDILITLTTPYAYGGGNLVVMVERPMDTQYYSSSDVFVTQSGTVPARTRNVYSDSTDYDPANPPTDTPEANFPRATFMFITDGLGSISGTVYEGATPLEGATVTVANTPLTYTTSATGTYNFPYVAEGNQDVSATKHGYDVVTHTVTVVEDETTTQDFVLTQLPQVTVSGRIVASDNPTVGIEGATIELSGYEFYSAVSNASGMFSIDNVYANQTYDYMVSYTGYSNTTGQVVVGNTNVDMGDVVVNEIAFPPVQVVATEAVDYSNVVVTWSEPGTVEPAWIHYDSGLNDDSIGTGGTADFDVAIRFPATALTEYAGASLQAVKVWPAQPGSFSVRVWTGGDASAPAQMVVDQPFTPAPLDSYNTVVLDTPVYISGTEELWFGYRCNVTSGYPAGCDAGPADDGLGNMMYFQGEWATLIELNPALDYNWNIQGWVGFGPPTRYAKLTPIPDMANRVSHGTLAATGIKKAGDSTLAELQSTSDRVREGYKVWRLLAANQDDENTWTLLTPNTITDLTYTDNAWAPLPSGVYKFAVKAVYTNDVLSTAALSNEIHKGMMGTLSGTITDFGSGSPIEGALVVCGDYSGTSNAQGVYSFPVYAGTYTVSVTKSGYQPYTATDVVVTGLQTTTLDIQMMEIAYPPYSVVANEAADFSNVVVTWLAPDPNAEPVEDFESGDFDSFDWIMGGTAPWTISTTDPHGGDYCAQSGDITHSQNSTIQITRDVIVAGEVSFWYKVSSESGWDFLTFYIDGVEMGTWSGTIPWTQATYPLSLGEHVMMWEYSKDGSVDSGSDCAWIDDVSFPASTGTAYYELSKLFSTASQNAETSDKNVTFQERDSGESVRDLVGYRVYRLLAANEDNESTWTTLTPSNITELTYTDNTWEPLPSGVYEFAIKAVYTNNVMSDPAFSNEIHKGMMGVLTGNVTEFGTNIPIEGATIIAGDYSGTSDAQGDYSFSVYAGTYEVTCSKTGYQTATQTGVTIVGLQTTTQDFVLTEITLPPGGVQAEEANPSTVNITWMEPGTGGGEWIHYD